MLNSHYTLILICPACHRFTRAVHMPASPRKFTICSSCSGQVPHSFHCFWGALDADGTPIEQYESADLWRRITGEAVSPKDGWPLAGLLQDLFTTWADIDEYRSTRNVLEQPGTTRNNQEQP